MPLAVIAQAPLRDFYTTPHRFSALGLEAVSRTFRENGWDTEVLILPLLGGFRTLPLPSFLDHLKPHILPGETGPARFFTHYKRFGPDFMDAAKIILNHNPDLVALSCFAFAYADDTIELAQALRKISSKTRIIAGGAGVSAFKEYFEETGLFDAVLSGEAENTLEAWLKGSEPDCPQNEPEPLWTITGNRITTVLSRGCPKRCRFCSQFLVHGRVLRKASMEAVKKMILSWPETVQEVNIEDDNLLLISDYFFEVLDLIRARFPGVRFFAENGMDYTLLNHSRLEELFHRGFRTFNLSLGSIHPDILASYERPADLIKWEALVQEIANRGAASTTYFICGLQDDSPLKTSATLKYIARFPTRPGISLFYPVPGLPGFTDKNLFRKHPPALTAGSSAWPWTGSLTTAQMVTAFRLSRLLALKTGSVWDRSVSTGTLWAEVRHQHGTKLIPVPGQEWELSSAVLGSENINFLPASELVPQDHSRPEDENHDNKTRPDREGGEL